MAAPRRTNPGIDQDKAVEFAQPNKPVGPSTGGDPDVLNMIDAVRSRMFNKETPKVEERKPIPRSRFLHQTSSSNINLPNASYACVEDSWAQYQQLYGPFKAPVPYTPHSATNTDDLKPSPSLAAWLAEKDKESSASAGSLTPDSAKKDKYPLAPKSADANKKVEDAKKVRRVSRRSSARVDIRSYDWTPPRD